MRKQKLLLVLPALFALQNTFAQTNSLTLSDASPKQAEKVKITYDPKGTALDGKKDISAEVYYVDGKDNPVAELDLKPTGTKLGAELVIPAKAKAFFIKIYSGDDIDNNGEKGYMFLIYGDKKPVEGAYESEAYLLASGIAPRFGKVKADNDLALELFEKENEEYPAGKKLYQYNYFAALAKKGDAESIALLKAKATALSKSDNEDDLMLAGNVFRLAGKKVSADSLTTETKKRFPVGKAAQDEAVMIVYREKDLTKKDSLYKAFMGKFSPENDDKNSIIDYIRVQFTAGYLQKGDKEAYDHYSAQVKNKINLAGEFNNTAYEWAKTGEKLGEAEKLSKQSLDILDESIKNAEPSPFLTAKTVAKRGKATYDTYADTYAFILYKEKKYDEALKYQKAVYATNTYNDPEINEHYVLILDALGKYADSKPVIESALKDGKGSDILKNELKIGYIKLKGSQAGYDTYLASLTNFAKNKKHEDLVKQMINQPAAAFALKDFDGNSVSLASLKGKVVIVDFWATWCGPCKASFPGMQTAVNKYKDDADVKFLFVDTWENGDNYTDGVKKFIADKKYTFHVLLDEKGADGRQSKVVSQFGVEGIPTKFIIDKSGNIRFKVVGFDGSADGLVDEVSAMIDLAKEPATASTEVKSK